MTQPIRLLLKSALLVFAALIFIAGTWLAISTLASFLAFYVGVFINTRPLQLLALFLVSIYAAYLAESTGLLGDIQQYVRERFARRQQRNAPQTNVTPVTVARLHYKLDDPDNSDEFNLFLDMPVVVTSPKDTMSPAEYAERLLLGPNAS